MGGKHEVDSNQEDEGPPQKRRSSPKPEEASRTVDTIDYFREHFCQNIPGRVLEQLKDGDSKPMMKVRLEAFNKHHAAQFFDNGSELVRALNFEWRYVVSNHYVQVRSSSGECDCLNL